MKPNLVKAKLLWISPAVERAMHRRGKCSGDLCPLKKPAPTQRRRKRVCDFCDVTEGDGVNVNECANCRLLCCTAHSVDAERGMVLCEECAPEEE